MTVVIALLLATAAIAAEPAWHWLPIVAEADRPCEVRCAEPGWSVVQNAHVQAGSDDGLLVLHVEPRLAQQISLRGPANAAVTLRLPPPGQAAGLTSDADGRLRLHGDPAILAVPRREAVADRRWGVLRLFERRHVVRCDRRLPAPEAKAGTPALTRQIAAAQAIDPSGHAVLIELSGADRFAAWKHRDYRQALAWLVADLAARGATHVVLAEPICPRAEEALLAPLRAAARDVAVAFRCDIIDTTELGDDDAWLLPSGLLGSSLNPAGLARQARLLAVWLPTADG